MPGSNSLSQSDAQADSSHGKYPTDLSTAAAQTGYAQYRDKPILLIKIIREQF
jgi:hypothetical protein